MIQLVDFLTKHPIIGFVGGVSTVWLIISLLYTLCLWSKGILPVWYRLGMALSKRKIAVFATTDFPNLRGMLVDSRLFAPSNIIQIDRASLKKAQSATLHLVHWKDFKMQLDDILRIKRDSDAIIVYAPQSEGLIDAANFDKINAERNAIIVNMRGRLLNDIFTSMITTNYE